MSEVKVGIALGGGGALGMAHIGVLKALAEHNINPSIVVGTSIGSLVGGVYASGLDLERIEQEALKVKTSHLIDLSLNMSGMLGGKSAIKVIKNILGEDFLIENLNIKFGAIAVDLLNCKEVLINKGSLLQAIRSSISVPGVFTPVKFENTYLVDGGVLNNLPEDLVKKMGADVVLSVDLMHEYKPTKPTTAIHSLAFSFFVMQSEVVKLKKKYADVRINLNLNKFKPYIFSKKTCEEMIKIGYDETIKLIPQIKKAIKKCKK